MRFLLFLLAPILVLALFLLSLAYFAVQSEPSVDTNVAYQIDNADSVDPLLASLQRALAKDAEPASLTLEQQQLAALLGLAHRGLPQIAGDVRLYRGFGAIHFSSRLPVEGSDLYLNLAFEFVSGEGFPLEAVTLGDIRLPGSMVVSMVTGLFDFYSGSSAGSTALATIESLDIEPEAVTLNLKPLNQVRQAMRDISFGPQSEEKRLLAAKTVRYLQFFERLQLENPNQQQMYFYLAEGFAYAQSISNEETAALDNEAVIMALAIFAGNQFFANFVNGVEAQLTPIPMTKFGLVIQQRNDLALHFIYSAAIKLLSQQQLTVAIGEFKELMDRRDGGSGYSFVDLAADMAGTEFAAAAINSESARYFQTLVSDISSDADFFPDTTGLPEGISKQQFTDEFGSVASEAYQQLIGQIERQLYTNPLYM